jgi:hypothetical protein
VAPYIPQSLPACDQSSAGDANQGAGILAGQFSVFFPFSFSTLAIANKVGTHICPVDLLSSSREECMCVPLKNELFFCRKEV